jgi:hypothetical protein
MIAMVHKRFTQWVKASEFKSSPTHVSRSELMLQQTQVSRTI